MTKRFDEENFRRLDARIKREDEDRWLSSRYAPRNERRRLVALYALNLELAKVRNVVSEPGLGAIRFQWWRDAVGEIHGGGPVRKHDVVEVVASAGIAEKTLQGLIDGHEGAFDASDRGLEPEALLMRAGAALLAPAHSWGEHIMQLAPAYAAARRGDSAATGPVLPLVPTLLRPAIIHAVLRHRYAAGKRPGPFSKRLAIMRAASGGRV